MNISYAMMKLKKGESVVGIFSNYSREECETKIKNKYEIERKNPLNEKGREVKDIYSIELKGNGFGLFLDPVEKGTKIYYKPEFEDKEKSVSVLKDISNLVDGRDVVKPKQLDLF